MVPKTFWHWIVWGCLFAAPLIVAADTASQKPEAFLPERVFEFKPVVEGTVIVHTFVVHNRGDAVLEILDLKSG